MHDTIPQPPERQLTELERADEAARARRARSGKLRPRTLHAIIEQAARLVNCGQCWARPGTPCEGADGYHVARFCRASRKGMLTGQDMATVLAAAPVVFTNATIIRDGALMHAEPHFMTHPLTGRPWCECPCAECHGHVEGFEGYDCLCEGCTCGDLDGDL